MKFKIILLNLFFPLFAFGQLSYNKDSLAEVLINDLKDSWNLGINDDPKQPLNIRVYNKYKTLFDANATIDDEFNVIFRYDEVLKKSVYKVDTNKAFDRYAHDLGLQIRTMKIDSIGEVNGPVIDGNEYIYKITRRVTVEKLRKDVLEDATTYYEREFEKRKIDFGENMSEEESSKERIKGNQLYNSADVTYKFQSYDTLILSIKFNNDSLPRIFKIDAINIKPISIFNDKDQDGILDKEERGNGADTIYGDFTASGLPDFDLDGTPDKTDRCKERYGIIGNSGCPEEYFHNNFSIFVFTGLMINNCNLSLPEPDQYGYAEIDVLQSQKGSFKNPSFSSTISSNFGAEFSYYFGKKAKHMGISIGVNYCGFNATYSIEDPVEITFKSNDGVNDYRRRIRIREGSEETLNYHVLNFPLLYKYRTKIGAKNENRGRRWSMEFSVGPSFVYFNNSSSYNVNQDFEGLYQVDTVNKDRLTWYDYFDEGSTWNVLLTTDAINNQSVTPGAEWVFNSLNGSGYDFATNKNYVGKDKKATRYSIALNLNWDLSFKVAEFMDVKFGVGFMVAPSLDGAAHYTPMDKTTDEYNSLYRSKIKSTYASYGLRAGIVIVLDKLDKTLGIE